MVKKDSKPRQRTKVRKPARPAKKSAAASTEETAAAEEFIRGVLVRGEAARSRRGKLPPGATHEIVEAARDDELPKIRRRRFSVA